MQTTAYGLELYTRMHIATRLAEAAAERQVRAPGRAASALRTWGRGLLTRIEQALWGAENSELSLDCFPKTCC